ncbi:MAG TPA: DUF4166 domain-containing protein [Xanthobacteraceae bacterium]|jgi:hypothetical protein|nr:DUF4166 domain-containing protein [Xanthobacteraceae bacterium]
MTASLKVLIIGGYGIFGGRIVELLEDEARLTLVVGGRSIAKARDFIASRKDVKAALLPAAFDRNGDVSRQMSAIDPHVVIDASGPFQDYGDDRYRVVEACLNHGANYLDLADGSDFVAAIGAFNDHARATGLFILSGVSSFPVLTAAAVRRLSAGMTHVKSIRGGIAPSPYAVVGENVIRAIASYAGQRITLMRNGAFATGWPLTERVRYTVATPGYVPLRNTLFSLVDVPDLRALPQLWSEASDIWMGAGPRPEVLHRFLICLAWLVRLRLLPSISPIAPLMHVVANRIRWGEHRGGMFIEVEGVTEPGVPCTRSWHMIAEGDDGPFIPSMAVEALIRNMLRGHPPAPGARSSVHDLELEDYDRLFSRRAIVTGFRDDSEQTGALTLYAVILGDALNRLPLQIRDIHDVRSSMTAEGRARVERGNGLLAWLTAAVFGFPTTNPDIYVRVRFDVSNGVETWTRQFGDDRFQSQQFAGSSRSDRLLCERFGPFTFAMALVVEGDRLSLVLRRWSFFGLPLPLWLCPHSDSYESAEQERFNFHVKISHPLTGLIIRYDGWLVPVKTEASRS